MVWTSPFQDFWAYQKLWGHSYLTYLYLRPGLIRFHSQQFQLFSYYPVHFVSHFIYGHESRPQHICHVFTYIHAHAQQLTLHNGCGVYCIWARGVCAVESSSSCLCIYSYAYLHMIIVSIWASWPWCDVPGNGSYRDLCLLDWHLSHYQWQMYEVCSLSHSDYAVHATSHMTVSVVCWSICLLLHYGKVLLTASMKLFPKVCLSLTLSCDAWCGCIG